jgi:2-hydroxyacyl-CoA lyase 1
LLQDKANRELVRKQCEDVSLPLSYHAVLSAIAAHLPRDAIIVNEGANTMDL